MQQDFLPRWNVICNTYPIPDLRLRFGSLARRIATNEIRLKVSALYKPGRKTVLCEADRVGVQPIIRFFEPALRDFYARVKDENTRDDEIIGMMLHEEYHLKHHTFNPAQGPNKRLEESLRESDTWWWTCETIFAPMMRAGRLRNLREDDAISGAMQCYNDSGGNPTADAWMRFCAADPELNGR